MRKTLQEQMTEKNWRQDLQKHIDNEQGRVWRQDADNYKAMKQEEAEKVIIKLYKLNYNPILYIY